MSETSTASISVDFFGLLAILFIGLKLGGVISWSWWWVTAPLWAPLATVIAIAIPALVIYFAVQRMRR